MKYTEYLPCYSLCKDCGKVSLNICEDCEKVTPHLLNDKLIKAKPRLEKKERRTGKTSNLIHIASELILLKKEVFYVSAFPHYFKFCCSDLKYLEETNKLKLIHYHDFCKYSRGNRAYILTDDINPRNFYKSKAGKPMTLVVG